MKSLHLLIDKDGCVVSASPSLEETEREARVSNVGYGGRPYTVTTLHFDGPVGHATGHALCEAAGIDLRGLLWKLGTLQSRVRALEGSLTNSNKQP